MLHGSYLLQKGVADATVIGIGFSRPKASYFLLRRLKRVLLVLSAIAPCISVSCIIQNSWVMQEKSTKTACLFAVKSANPGGLRVDDYKSE